MKLIPLAAGLLAACTTTEAPLPDAFTPLRLSSGDTDATFVAMGASLVSLRVGGQEHVVGLPAFSDYADNPAFVGSTIGPVANRIRDGRFRIDGTEYGLATTANGHTLHSGPDGFHTKAWNIVAHEDDRLVLRYVRPDGEAGFPGRLSATLTATLSPGTLDIVHEATTDAPTPVAMTAHTYFRMPGTDRVDQMGLYVYAPTYTQVDVDGLPLEYAADMLPGPFDFVTTQALGDIFIDHSFNVRGEAFREMLHVYGPTTKLTVSSDLPAVQIYTGEALTDVGLPARSGLAIEPQYPPNWINTEHKRDVILRPAQTYRHRIRYAITAPDELVGG